MSPSFPASLDFVLRHECVFAPGHAGDLQHVIAEDVPGDAGGVTKFGIDQASHPGVNVRALTLPQAAALYRAGEWTACHGDALPPGLDLAVFDITVNNGLGTAIRLLQAALNAVGQAPALLVDGRCGAQTLAAAQAAGAAALPALLQRREALYRAIAARRPSQAKFLRGWLQRNADLALASAALARPASARAVS